MAPDGTAHLIVVNADEAAAAASRAATVTGYEGFSTERPLHGWTEHAATVARVAAERRRWAVRVAVERDVVRLGDGRGAGVAAPTASCRSTSELSAARMVKTADEIAALRRCADVSSVGQRAALAGTRAGRTELEVFADVRSRWRRRRAAACAWRAS